MDTAVIAGITYYLPEIVLDNQSLSEQFPQWTPEKIQDKTGIIERRLTTETQCASDLAEEAAKQLFATGMCSPQDIDFVLFCTQSPDYFLPTTACVLQHKLGIPTTAGALDFNLGCSGFVYGLSLAKGLVETGQATTVLLLTADTYSKYIHPDDMNVKALFGDAGAATLVRRQATEGSGIGPFVFGTDGAGKDKLMVKTGAARHPVCSENDLPRLFMDGPEIFAFTISSVPKAINALLEKSHLALDDIDMFVFHQANEFMLKHLQKKTKIPDEKFCIDLSHTGNTVSATIPIALCNLLRNGKVKSGDRVMLVGFGVGYSWAATLIHIP